VKKKTLENFLDNLSHSQMTILKDLEGRWEILLDTSFWRFLNWTLIYESYLGKEHNAALEFLVFSSPTRGPVLSGLLCV
jgi:hypothetical protein